MRNILLSIAVVMAAMSVNAQEYCAFNADENPDFAALGLSSQGTTVGSGKVIGRTDHVVATIGAEDFYKPVSTSTVTIGDITFSDGLQGSQNPKDVDDGTPSSTLEAPASGAFFCFDVKADGYLYVVHKASSNKPYTVFENGTAIGYTYAAVGDGATLRQVYGFELKGGGDHNYLADAGITRVYWPEQIYLGWDGVSEWTKIGKNSMGVMKFRVLAGRKYIVNGNASKMIATGFYYDTSGEATISADVDGNNKMLLHEGSVPYVSGTCGKNLIWSYVQAEKTLIVSGSGAMTQYFKNVPWKDLLNDIEKLKIGDGVTSVCSFAFWGCVNLTEVKVSAATPPTANENTFSNYNIPLYVPKGCASAYKSTSPWSNFKRIYEYVPENVPTSIASIPAEGLRLRSAGGTLTIEGAADGTLVRVYSADGSLAGSAVSGQAEATVNTSLPSGSVAIVKVGERKMKVVVR